MVKSSCAICGVQCKDKDKIEARRGTYYNVCNYCFIKYEFTDMKEIRKLIRRKAI